MFTLAVICESLPKPAGGWVWKCVDIDGRGLRLHAFTDMSAALALDRVFEVHYESREIGSTAIRYYVATKRPRLVIDSVSNYGQGMGAADRFRNWVRTHWDWSGLERHRSPFPMLEAAKAYGSDPKRYQHYDRNWVWPQISKKQAELEEISKANKGSLGFYHTFTDPAQTAEAAKAALSVDDADTALKLFRAEQEKNIDAAFIHGFDASPKKYGTRASYTSTRPLKESALTQALMDTDAQDLDFNDLPRAHMSAFVDSMTLQVAFREREIVEVLVYFALILYLKRSHHFPTYRIGPALKWLRNFISSGRKQLITKKLFWRLHKMRLIDLACPSRHKLNDDTVFRIRNQAQYVSKRETAWNYKTGRSWRPWGLWKFNPRLRDGKGEWIRAEPHDSSGEVILPHTRKGQQLYQMHRPYFDFVCPRTMKMDLGFVHLLNADIFSIRAWTYEMVLGSWDKYPLCRARILRNLLVTKSTQIRYERASTHMLKHYNYTEIPADMLDRLMPNINNSIFAIIEKNGKFKISRSGRVYRQEGNSYTSDRCKWKTSTTCARIKLSQKMLRAWAQIQPHFQTRISDGRTEYGGADMMRIDSRLHKADTEKLLPVVQIQKKSEIGTRPYFGIYRHGLRVPTTDPRNWDGFDPLLVYEPGTGDRVVADFLVNRRWIDQDLDTGIPRARLRTHLWGDVGGGGVKPSPYPVSVTGIGHHRNNYHSFSGIGVLHSPYSFS